jgi:hypothetical protein
MKLNSILKLSSLGLVSLGLVSTVALTATSCSDVQVIEVTGEFKPTGESNGESSVKINNLTTLGANDKSTTVVRDYESYVKYGEEMADSSPTVFVIGEAGKDGAVIFTVTTADAEVKSYSLNGLYALGDSSKPDTLKFYPIIVKITVTAA